MIITEETLKPTNDGFKLFLNGWIGGWVVVGESMGGWVGGWTERQMALS